MPIYTDSFKDIFDFDMGGNIKINDLDNFKESLERYLLSEVTIRKCPSKNGHCNLAIEINSDFTVKDILVCLNNQNNRNGGDKENENRVKSPNLFFNALSELYSKNTVGLDIDELSIYLKDTAIIIEKIYDQSIPDQLETILGTLVSHYSYYTRGIVEIPYEIYIPVFEEDAVERENTLSEISLGNNSQKDYYRFWGLYFESEEDALIYDLENKTIGSGDLFMLNP